MRQSHFNEDLVPGACFPSLRVYVFNWQHFVRRRARISRRDKLLMPDQKGISIRVSPLEYTVFTRRGANFIPISDVFSKLWAKVKQPACTATTGDILAKGFVYASLIAKVDSHESYCRNEKTSRKFDLPEPLAPMRTLMSRSSEPSISRMLLKPLMAYAFECWHVAPSVRCAVGLVNPSIAKECHKKNEEGLTLTDRLGRSSPHPSPLPRGEGANG